MWCKKNITLNSKNLTAHFTGVQKIITLSSIILMLSFVNITLCFSNNFVSALSYQSEVGIGFTFSPTLSISLSSSDLVISNLTPGSSNDSNSINVSVATNASYGYTLSVNASSDNLVHSNNTNTFSSIATDADLSSLEDSEDNNIWGYSTSLDNGTTWSNYNGLSSSNTTLLDTNTNNTVNGIDTIDFKIGAKAGSTQASGIYTNTINFIAVSKVAPMSLLDSFITSGAEQLNGYYKMQDMTHDICENVDIEESELQLIDIRDNKIYWIAKLKDGNCWMTQNLDLDLSHEVALTSETSDIDPESYGKTIYMAETGYSKDEATGIVSWLPSTIDCEDAHRADTIDMVWSNDTAATVPGWTNDNNKPYSANAGDRYRYTNSSGNEAVYTSLNACLTGTNNDKAGCQHTHIGNYYNWSAAVASNNTTSAAGTQTNSICPKNWGVPINGAYNTMLTVQEVYKGSGGQYLTNGFLKIRTHPLYFTQSGYIHRGTLSRFGNYGYYWSSTSYNNTISHALIFSSNSVTPSNYYYDYGKALGTPIRCMANTN